MQLHTIRNVKNLYDSRKKNIDLFKNYSKIKSELFIDQNMMKLREEDLEY